MSRVGLLLLLLGACGRWGFDAVVADAAGDGSLARPQALVYPASVAECIDPAAPDLSACRQVNGNLELVIDTGDAASGNAWHAFLRFDVGDAIAGRKITSVMLRLVATDAVLANGPSSGQVWSVAPFSKLTLATAVPNKIEMLAPAQGAVSQLLAITWPLPVAGVAANAPLFLGLYPSSANGVNYWNLLGPSVPQLIIDVE